MRYLLDTSTCVGILRGRSPTAKARLIEFGSDIALCSIVYYELRTGALKSREPAAELQKVRGFHRRFECLPFRDETASVAAEIRAALEEKGLKIGPLDVLIAATALQHDLVLVTSNVDEFSRIPGLRLEDWQRTI